jgi:hypothetical protein
MNNLLEIATKRFKNKNSVYHEDYKLPMEEFILHVYINSDPACYGKQQCKKLIKDLERSMKTNVFTVGDSADKGDIAFMYPTFDSLIGKCFFEDTENKQFYYLSPSNPCVKTLYYENKLTFLGKNGGFTIRNLRYHQNIDGYIITTVDCEDKFKIEYFVLSKEDLFDNCALTFSYMNGTKKVNNENKIVGVGTQFKKNSYHHKLIRMNNKLEDTTYSSLVKFLTLENKRLKKEFGYDFKKLNKESFGTF